MIQNLFIFGTLLSLTALSRRDRQRTTSLPADRPTAGQRAVRERQRGVKGWLSGGV
jgi:hypothetical protein